MHKYQSKENLINYNSEKNEISSVINDIIQKIDNLNKTVLPKSELNNKFS